MDINPLNQLRIVGRQRERALLRDVYDSVCQDGAQPAVVWLHGPTGCGKSALAEAFVDDVSSEAHIFRGIFDHTASSGAGFARMLADFFGTPNNDWEVAFRCVHRAYQQLGFEEFEARYDVIGLAEIIAAGADGGGQRTRCGFESPRMKNLALTRLFGRLAQSRPVVVWFDDADASIAALSLVRHLLADDVDDLPLMLVVTAQRGNIDQPDTRKERITGDIIRATRANCLGVGALADEHQIELIEQFAPLAPDLTERLVRHTRGHPLFVVQLLTDWLERDLLVADGQHFVLREDQVDPFPSSVDLVWRRRVDRALQGLSAAEADDARRAIEVAAVLGPMVNVSEWRAACYEANIGPPDKLFGPVIDHDLCELNGDTWRFSHGTFQDAVSQRTRQEGRWQFFHRACARALRRLHGEASGHAHRIAEHLIAGGQRQAALEPLIRASRQFHDAGRFEMSQSCLERRDEVLDALGVPADDRRRVESSTWRAHIALTTGRPQHAHRLATRALEAARANDYDEEIAGAQLVLGRHVGSRGQRRKSIPLLEDAIQRFERAGNIEGLAGAQASLALAHYTMGDAEQARKLFEHARDGFDSLGDKAAAARAVRGLVDVWILEDEWDKAARAAEEALQIARDLTNPILEAGCWNHYGAIARNQQDWKRARSAYEKAARLYRLAQSRNEHSVRFYLASVDIWAGEYERAREQLAEILPDVKAAGLQAGLGMVFVALACCEAADGTIDDFDTYFERACARFEQLEQAYVEEGMLAEFAAEELLARGERARAERAFTVASQRFEQLGRSRDVERLRGRLAELAGPDSSHEAD